MMPVEVIVFGGIVCYRSIQMYHKDEGGRLIEDAPLMVGSGVMDLSGGKAKHMWSLWRS